MQNISQTLERILETGFGVKAKELRPYLRFAALDVEALEKKLLLLEQEGLLPEAPAERVDALMSAPLFRCTYEQLLFAVQVPQLLSFTQEQTAAYKKDVLRWSRYTDLRLSVLPHLERLCGAEAAGEILRQLYLSSYTTVGEEALLQICRKLAQYPDPQKKLPAFLGENWYFVFSVYSDPVAALSLLETVFETGHVLEVFIDDREWSRHTAPAADPLQAAQEAQKQAALTRAKEKFKAYLK